MIQQNWERQDGERRACWGSNLERFLQPVVLAVLNQEPRTGYGVVKKMDDYITFEDSAPDPTGVYRYLRLMRQKGLITRDETAESGTPLYHITPLGQATLQSWTETLREYAVKIEALTEQLSQK